MERALFRPTRIAGLVPAAAFVLASCGGGGGHAADAGAKAKVAPAAAAPVDIPPPGPGSSPRVTVKDFIYRPSPDTVAVGTKLIWVNGDDLLHTVTSGTRAAPTPVRFGGKLDGAGSTLEVTLDDPGTYPYFCSIHPGAGMTGEIVVR